MQQLRQLRPVSCRLIEQDQKLAVGQHQTGRFRAQTFLNILRGGGHGSGVLAKAFPALVEKLCGVVILEEQIHLVHEYPCVPSGQPICRHAVLDRLQHHIQRRGLELFTHLVEVKTDNAVINIKIGFVGEHIQAALHEQLRCKGQFLCFTLRLPLDLVAPIRESRNPAFAAALDEIVIDIGGTTVNDRLKYSSIMRIGGAGDKGRDVIAYRKDGGVDYFQCKHYNSALAPSNYYLELGKLCYYTYTKDIPLPKSYYIVASNDIGPTLQDLLDNSAQLLSSLLDNWDTYCRFKITKSKEINLDADLLGYIRSFDFSIIKTYPIAQIIDEHLNTVYGSIRFGTRTPTLPAPLSPSAEIDPEEMEYVSALLAAYSEELGMIIDTPKALEAYERFFSHFNRQRKDYYSAETIRRFVRDTLISSFQFDVLKEEIYNGIIDVHEQDYSTGYKRLVADLQQAAITNTSKSLLDSKLHCIGNCERKGVCHMLVRVFLQKSSLQKS